jgi:hypothetical protein
MLVAAALVASLPLLASAQEAQGAPPPYPPAPQYAPPPQGAPPAPRAGPARQRGSWYIGFGLGAGDGRILLEDGTADFSDMVGPEPTPMAFNFRVGGTVTPNLLVGFDGGFVAASSSASGIDSSIQLNYYDAGFMYFPAEHGFFLRGALGLSSVVWEVDPGFSADARGFNVLGGAGYAFWLGRTFNLTLNLEAARHWFSEVGLEGGTAWSAWLGFDWY